MYSIKSGNFYEYIDREKTSNFLFDKLDRTISLRLEDDKDFKKALICASECLTENSFDSRYELCSALELRQLDKYNNIIEKYAATRDIIDEMRDNAQTISNIFSEITDNLDKVHGSGEDFIDSCNSLNTTRRSLLEQEQILDEFISNCQLKSCDLDVLNSSPVNDQFFSVFDSLVHIISYVRQKAALESDQKTFHEALDQLTLIHKSALARILDWMAIVCKQSTIHENTALLIKAITHIQASDFIDQFMENFTHTRSQSLTESFIDALTCLQAHSSSSNHTPSPPIDLCAHDTAQYAGEMFGWVRRAVCEETDLWCTLFGGRHELDSGRQQLLWSGVLGKLCTRCDCMLVSTEPSSAACPPDVSAQTSPCHMDAGVCYQVVCLINYYVHATPCLVVATTFASICAKFYARFWLLFDDQLNSLIRQALTADPTGCLVHTLRPQPQALADCLRALRQCIGDTKHAPAISKQKSQRVQADSVCEARASGMASREVHVSHVVQEFIALVRKALQASTACLRDAEAAVLGLNTWSCVHECLVPVEYTDVALGTVTACMRDCVAALVVLQTNSLVQVLGLEHVHEALRALAEGGGGSCLEAAIAECVRAPTITRFVQHLDVFLAKPDSLLLSALHCVCSGQHRATVTSAVSQQLLALYRVLYTYTHAHDTDVCLQCRTLMTRSPEQLCLSHLSAV